MRRLFVFACVVSSLVMGLVSCGASTIGDRLERYIDKVEKECDNYSETDWEKVTEKVDEFVDEFSECKKDIKPEQREKFVKALGRFDRIAFKAGIESLFDTFDDFPAYFEGLGDSED